MRHDIDKNRSESIRQGSILTVQRIIESLLIIQNCSCISVQTCLSKIVTNDDVSSNFLNQNQPINFEWERESRCYASTHGQLWYEFRRDFI